MASARTLLGFFVPRCGFGFVIVEIGAVVIMGADFQVLGPFTPIER